MLKSAVKRSWKWHKIAIFRKSLILGRFSSLTTLKKALVIANISSELPLVDIKSPSCSNRPLKIAKMTSKSSRFDFANFSRTPFWIFSLWFLNHVMVFWKFFSLFYLLKIQLISTQFLSKKISSFQLISLARKPAHFSSFSWLENQLISAHFLG